jgi:hypothetical protein
VKSFAPLNTTTLFLDGAAVHRQQYLLLDGAGAYRQQYLLLGGAAVQVHRCDTVGSKRRLAAEVHPLAAAQAFLIGEDLGNQLPANGPLNPGFALLRCRIRPLHIQGPRPSSPFALPRLQVYKGRAGEGAHSQRRRSPLFL